MRRWDHGLGSDYSGATALLAMAIYSGRVLLLRTAPDGWVHATGCEHPGPECFFQPVSKCSLSTVEHLVKEGKLTYRRRRPGEMHIKSVEQGEAHVLEAVNYKRHMYKVRYNLQNMIPRALMHLKVPDGVLLSDVFSSNNNYTMKRAWHTQAALYLLRLNESMQKLAKNALKDCAGSDASGGCTNAQRFVRNTIGLPVRGSDKCKMSYSGRNQTLGEMNCLPVESFVENVKRMQTVQPWLNDVLVTSEDAVLAKQVYEALKYAKFTVRVNPHDVQQGSGVPISARNGTKFVHKYQVTQSMLTTLTCQVMPMYHIITMRSNFHNLIDMLAKVVPGKPSHLSYPIGDMYRPT